MDKESSNGETARSNQLAHQTSKMMMHDTLNTMKKQRRSRTQIQSRRGMSELDKAILLH